MVIRAQISVYAEILNLARQEAADALANEDVKTVGSDS
jgi:hypothetical protein